MYPHWVTEVIVPSGVRDTCPRTDDLSTNADRQLSDQRDSAVTRRSYGITTDVLSCSAKLKTRRQTLPSIIIRRYYLFYLRTSLQKCCIEIGSCPKGPIGGTYASNNTVSKSSNDLLLKQLSPIYILFLKEYCLIFVNI